jgi:hypothetical protein
MDNYFVDVIEYYDRNIRDIKHFQDNGSVLQLEDQVDAQESKHGQQGQEGRELQDAFDQVSPQQCQDTPLQSAAGTINPCMFPE